jgi:hypothetical protein
MGANYCTNAEWLKNRAITLGCGGTSYCPNDAVTRGAMALFMNRLGVTLTPSVTFYESTLGATDPGPQPVVCQSGPVSAANYPRQARMRVSMEGVGSATFVLGGRPVYSTDGGSLWQWPNNLAFRTGMTSGFWNQLTAETPINLAAGATYIFGIQLYLVSGRGTLPESRCHWTLEIDNANGTSSPFDTATPPPLTTNGDR